MSDTPCPGCGKPMLDGGPSIGFYCPDGWNCAGTDEPAVMGAGAGAGIEPPPEFTPEELTALRADYDAWLAKRAEPAARIAKLEAEVAALSDSATEYAIALLEAGGARKRIRQMRVAILSVFGAMTLILFWALLPNPRINTLERSMALVGAVCCGYQFMWAWRHVSWENFIGGVRARARKHA